MNQLQSPQPHFVRCIVLNPDKQPEVIDVKLVLDQLRGMPGIIPSAYLDSRKACIRMLGALESDESVYKIGLPKVFFKSGVKRTVTLESSASLLVK